MRNPVKRYLLWRYRPSKYEKKYKEYLGRYEILKNDGKTQQRVKRIGGGYHGSNAEFKDTVLAYWKKYGIKPERYWYALYCDGLDAYDPRFISDKVWFENILPYFNDFSMRKAYRDKGMIRHFFTGVKTPETIIKNMAGYFYNGDEEEPITREEAERIAAAEPHLIIKPSIRSGEGRRITFYDRDDESSLKIPAIFDTFGTNFVVQRLVKQHPDLARLNASTLNTLRVLSFHFKGEVHILSAQLRIGGAGARVDNVSAGGCACAVKPDGWLRGESVTRQSTWTDETPSGIKLNTIHVPNYEGIIDAIKRLHAQLPYFNIVGWDFAVDEVGDPVLIEFNSMPGQNQIGGREPTFGNMTEEVLEDVFIKKTLKDTFSQ